MIQRKELRKTFPHASASRHNPESITKGETVFDDPDFWKNTMETKGGCIEWQLCVSEFGYGRLCKRSGPYKGNWLAHRYAYTRANGKIPQRLLICHSCDNPKCVNPAHLFAGTHADNAIDAFQKGRSSIRNPKDYPNWKPTVLFGASNGATKISESDAAKIFEMRAAGMLQREIADLFGLSQVAVSVILRGKTCISKKAFQAKLTQ